MYPYCLQVCGLAGGKYVLPCVAADWAPGTVLTALSGLVLKERLENLEQEHFDVLRFVMLCPAVPCTALPCVLVLALELMLMWAVCECVWHAHVFRACVCSPGAQVVPPCRLHGERGDVQGGPRVAIKRPDPSLGCLRLRAAAVPRVCQHHRCRVLFHCPGGWFPAPLLGCRCGYCLLLGGTCDRDGLSPSRPDLQTRLSVCGFVVTMSNGCVAVWVAGLAGNPAVSRAGPWGPAV
jgi:hypothetical protein